MKKLNFSILVFLLISLQSFSRDKILQIHGRNYNNQGLVIDKTGKLYTGKAREKLKHEGYLVGDVKNGDISGIWEYYEKNELKGYHYYLSNGDTTFAFDLNGKVQWIEVFGYNKNYNLSLDNGEIKSLFITYLNKEGKKTNIFEYEEMYAHHFDATIVDYDYASRTVIDYFENKSGEQEIMIRDFKKHKELVKIICDNHKVLNIYLNGEVLEVPEDADYKLTDHFSISFTDVKNENDFDLHLIKNKKTGFEVNIKNGEIIALDKYISKNEKFVLFEKKKGYLSSEKKKLDFLINELSKKAQKSI